MTKELYFETFEEQERKFEEVWKTYPLVMKPTIYHWWFYRYLQISPSYINECLFSEWRWNRFIYKNKNAQLPKWIPNKKGLYLENLSKENPTAKNIQAAENYNRDQTEYRKQRTRTFTAFNSVLRLDFTRWWYERAHYQFRSQKILIPDIFQYYYLPSNRKHRPNEFERFIEKFRNNYQEIITSDVYPPVIAVNIPILGDKKKTIKHISKFLDANVTFTNPNAPTSYHSIAKSKLRLKTFPDCFKLFELRAHQGDRPDLLRLALIVKESKTSLAGYKASKTIDEKNKFLNSIRSGTRRDINLAILLAENAAKGVFPSTKESELSFEIDVDYNETSKRLKMLAQYNQTTDCSVKELKAFVKAESKKGFDAEHRKYPKRGLS